MSCELSLLSLKHHPSCRDLSKRNGPYVLARSLRLSVTVRIADVHLHTRLCGVGKLHLRSLSRSRQNKGVGGDAYSAFGVLVQVVLMASVGMMPLPLGAKSSRFGCSSRHSRVSACATYLERHSFEAYPIMAIITLI